MENTVIYTDSKDDAFAKSLVNKLINRKNIKIVCRTGVEKIPATALPNLSFCDKNALVSSGYAFCREILSSRIYDGFSSSVVPIRQVIIHSTNIPISTSVRNNTVKSFVEGFINRPISVAVKRNHNYTKDVCWARTASLTDMAINMTAASGILNLLRNYQIVFTKQGFRNIDQIIDESKRLIIDFYNCDTPWDFVDKHELEQYYSYDYLEERLWEEYPPFTDPLFVLWLIFYKRQYSPRSLRGIGRFSGPSDFIYNLSKELEEGRANFRYAKLTKQEIQEKVFDDEDFLKTFHESEYGVIKRLEKIM